MQRGRRLIEDELEVHLLALVVPHYLDKPGGTTTLAPEPLAGPCTPIRLW